MCKYALELIIRERREMIDHVMKDLHELSADWGILIETFALSPKID